MKKQIPLIVIQLLMTFVCKAQYDHQNINLLGNFHDSTVVPEPSYGIKYQACWGWVNSSANKEYGIIGSTAGTYIVDVTNPSALIQCDYIPHHATDCIWHEYKTYGNFLYIISDDPGTGFQIADLSYLPDSVHLVYDSIGLFEHAHTIFIDNDKMYVGIVSSGFNSSSMNVYSLADPIHPLLLRQLDQDYSMISQVHDMFVSNDTVYASCGYDGLYIFRYDSIANQFNMLSNLQDNFNIYNHSSVLSADHNTLYVCEEIPQGQPVKIVDVDNISNPSLLSTFYSNLGATPHNPEVKNDILYIAYYMDGVYAYDITSPHNPVQIGYFDTYPVNTPGSYPPPGYAGCWSTYSMLPSGILLASDMQSGLFTLDVSLLTDINSTENYSVNVFPNPARNFLKIKNSKPLTIELLDFSGKLCLSAKCRHQETILDVSDLSNGIYILRILDDNKIINKKIVLQK